MDVTLEHLANAVGSGDLPVLATPTMLALMENASMLAVESNIPDGSTTVGGFISSNHLLPTAFGRRISATAELTAVEGRKLTFRVEAFDQDGNRLGAGEHIRFIVDKEKFMQKL